MSDTKKRPVDKSWKVWVATCRLTGRYLCGEVIKSSAGNKRRAKGKVREYMRAYGSPQIHLATLTLDPPPRRKPSKRSPR